MARARSRASIESTNHSREDNMRNSISSFCVSLASVGIISACGSGAQTETDATELRSLDSAAPSAAADTQVTIDAKKTLGVLTPIALGVNAAAWDDNLVGAVVPGLLSDA